MINLLKQIGLVSVVISVLAILGNTIGTFEIWNWLRDFFVLIRHLLALMDWIMPTETIIILIGWTFVVLIALWGFKAVMWLVHWFKKY